MIHREALPITMEQLTEDWRTWIGDKSLHTQRFGQYVVNKRLTPGWCWPRCYYADTTSAWTMLFAWINQDKPTYYPIPFP